MHGIDRAEKSVERRGLARTGRAGDEKNAVRFDDDFADHCLVVRRETQFVETQEYFPARQQTQGNAFAVNRRHRRNADVNLLALDADVDAAVLRQAFFGNVHAAHHLDARNERGLIAFQLRRHRRLMQNAVNAVANAQFVLRRFKVNVCRAVFERLPDDLVDEFDDTGLLIVLGNFLVVGDFQLHRLVIAHFIKRFGADAVIFLQCLFDFSLRRERELHRHPRVEPHGIHHRGIERIADNNLERAVFHVRGQHGILKCDFRGNFVPRLRRSGVLGQIQKCPAERLRQLLEKSVLRQAALAGDEPKQRLRRAVVRGGTPRLAPVVKLDGRRVGDRCHQIFYRAKTHVFPSVWFPSYNSEKPGKLRF